MKYKKWLVMIPVLAVIAVFAYIVLGNTGKDYEDTIAALTKEKPEAVVTVGVWEDGEAAYRVFGENGKELPQELHTYAIGSVTKTFTGSLIAKQVENGKLQLDSPIGHLSFAELIYIPTIRQLVTHTSGLADEWETALESNPEAAFNREQMVELFEKQELIGADYEPYYSNFGAALAGSVAAASEQKTYEEAMNAYILQDLGLQNTKVGGKGDLDNYWDWKSGDEMMGAGAITSDVMDLLEYGRLHMQEELSHLKLTHEPLCQFTEDYDCGYFWLIDKENDMIWHNGELSMENDDGEEIGFQAFLGFSKASNRVVVVLSNMIAYDEDENAYADLLGYQLMESGL